MKNSVTAQHDSKAGKSIRDGGAISYSISESTLGLVLAAQSERGLCCVMMGEERDVLRAELQKRFPRAVLSEKDSGAEAGAAGVVDMIESPGGDPKVTIDMGGTEFQQKVWRALLEIPPGTTSTYAEIATRIGTPNAVRAVGTACGANLIAVVIPCHRVVSSSGRLSGYRWGIERKQTLLEREASKSSTDGQEVIND